ncbi:ribonuclease H-like domain-containing protein, partial [Tanacetum coccineum]
MAYQDYSEEYAFYLSFATIGILTFCDIPDFRRCTEIWIPQVVHGGSCYMGIAGASSHLNFNTSNLSTIFDKCLFPSVHVGDGKSIPVTNTRHSIIPSHHHPLHLHNVLITPNIIRNLISVRQFTRDNNYTIEFDAFGFYVMDLLWIVLSSFDVTARAISIQLPSHQLLPLLFSQQVPPRGINASDIRQLGVDFDETFSPVVKPATIRTVLSLAVSRQWPIHQLDVKNAFLNEVFVWFEIGTSCLVPAVAYLLIYVDDIILTASSPVLLQQIVDSLHKEFDMTDLGALNYFLGISVVCHPTGLFLSQKKYARHLFERAHMVNCNPSQTPIDTDSKLGSDGVPVQDPTLYRSLAGGAPVSYLYSPRFVLCSLTGHSGALSSSYSFRYYILVVVFSAKNNFVMLFWLGLLQTKICTEDVCDNLLKENMVQENSFLIVSFIDTEKELVVSVLNDPNNEHITLVFN